MKLVILGSMVMYALLAVVWPSSLPPVPEVLE
jgi:hypothetical protein